MIMPEKQDDDVLSKAPGWGTAAWFIFLWVFICGLPGLVVMKVTDTLATLGVFAVALLVGVSGGITHGILLLHSKKYVDHASARQILKLAVGAAILPILCIVGPLRSPRMFELLFLEFVPAVALSILGAVAMTWIESQSGPKES
jgi:hypothetical protein